MSGRFGELLLILLIILVLFGAGRIPKIMGDIGSGIKALRDGLHNKNRNPGEEDDSAEEAEK